MFPISLGQHQGVLGTKLARIPPQVGVTARDDDTLDALPADAGVNEDAVLAPIAIAHEQRCAGDPRAAAPTILTRLRLPVGDPRSST